MLNQPWSAQSAMELANKQAEKERQIYVITLTATHTPATQACWLIKSNLANAEYASIDLFQ